MLRCTSKKEVVAEVHAAEKINDKLHKIKQVVTPATYKELRRQVKAQPDYRSKCACIDRFIESW